MLESVSRLWPVRSLTHDHNLLPPVERWSSSLSARCHRVALMRVFFSWKVTLLSFCLPLTRSLVNSTVFVFKFSGRPQWAGTHCVSTRLCCATPWRLCARRRSVSPSVVSKTDSASDRKTTRCCSLWSGIRRDKAKRAVGGWGRGGGDNYYVYRYVDSVSLFGLVVRR